MDYSEIVRALQAATPFDLYRLRIGIDALLDDPARLLPIKRRVYTGLEIRFFNARENRIMTGVVEKVQRTTLDVRAKPEGTYWRIPLCAVNMAGVETDISPASSAEPLAKNHFKVGDAIGFQGRDNRERYGVILKLNQKTATILTREGTRWRVVFSLLFKVMDGGGDPGASSTPPDIRSVPGPG
ncbi:MAG: hypothetical protein HQM03_10870 [Magnetococcales bacterium]|nr:hypothetical protein [Magnetococcales bacterium]